MATCRMALDRRRRPVSIVPLKQWEERMKSILAGAGMVLLASYGPALAGSWTCGQGCDPATLKGVSWTISAKCVDTPEPELRFNTSKAYNQSAEDVNKWIAKKQEYFKCVAEEVNADFTATSENMQNAARASLETPQKAFSDRVEQISKDLDEAVKKL